MVLAVLVAWSSVSLPRVHRHLSFHLQVREQLELLPHPSSAKTPSVSKSSVASHGGDLVSTAASSSASSGRGLAAYKGHVDDMNHMKDMPSLRMA